MKIFCDFHHAGLAQGIQCLFGERLGHEVVFPSRSFCDSIHEQWPGDDGGRVWVSHAEDPETWSGCTNGAMAKVCDRDGFYAEKWDLIIVSRTESQKIVRDLLAEHQCRKDMKLLAVHGNEGGGYDYGWIKNLLTSDLSTSYLAPLNLHKLHYCQEIGKNFMDRPFHEITEQSLKRVHCYMNFLKQYHEPWKWGWDRDRYIYNGICPHCQASCADGVPAVAPSIPSPYEQWLAVQALLDNSDIEFNSYGHGCKEGNVLSDSLPAKYSASALSWHYKHIEGYGFSLLQSVAAGRLVMVPRGFYRYRTAGRFLIHGLTCFETEWDASSMATMIQWYTADLSRANDYAFACYGAGRGLMNWKHEADRVREFLKDLQ